MHAGRQSPYEVIREGENWRLWKVRDANLTYAELLDYVGACTDAIAALARFVGRGVFDFRTATTTAETYVAEYIKGR